MPPTPYVEMATISPVRALDDLDPDGYLAANPDVKAAGVSARDHFVAYGAAEKRRQFINVDLIGELRRMKMEGVLFRREPAEESSELGPLNFLTPEMKSDFEIPSAPPVAANDYHPEIIDIIRRNRESLFLDVGAGLRHTYYSNVVNAEIWASASTDVICVSEDMPFADEQFDYVFCFAVLEHTKRPWLAAEEIIRVTKPGGMMRIDWPFLAPVHGYPHHYFNATPKGHRSQFEDRCDILSSEVRIWQHPIFTLSWMLDEWQNGLPEADRAAFQDIKLGELIGGVRHRSHLAEQPFCANLSRKTQEIIAAGTTLVARKR